jgi:hypothetical protein
MMDFLSQLEQSGFATWVRESNSLFAYPCVLFLHTIGMGFVAGISALVDLRILGCGNELPLTGMRRLFPYMWGGFWLNAATGVVLFVIDATTKAINPVFYTKIAFIAVAVGLCVVQGRSFRDPFLDKRPIEMNGKMLALVSIVCWIGAITTGRLLAYIGPGVISSGGS